MISKGELGKRFYMIRHDLGLNQEEFGAPIGLGKSAIHKLEKGTQNIAFQDVVKLAKAHNFSIHHLGQPQWDLTACMRLGYRPATEGGNEPPRPMA